MTIPRYAWIASWFEVTAVILQRTVPVFTRRSSNERGWSRGTANLPCEANTTKVRKTASFWEDTNSSNKHRWNWLISYSKNERWFWRTYMSQQFHSYDLEKRKGKWISYVERIRKLDAKCMRRLWWKKRKGNAKSHMISTWLYICSSSTHVWSASRMLFFYFLTVIYCPKNEI